jgi:hypothetical protein
MPSRTISWAVTLRLWSPWLVIGWPRVTPDFRPQRYVGRRDGLAALAPGLLLFTTWQKWTIRNLFSYLWLTGKETSVEENFPVNS